MEREHMPGDPEGTGKPGPDELKTNGNPDLSVGADVPAPEATGASVVGEVHDAITAAQLEEERRLRQAAEAEARAQAAEKARLRAEAEEQARRDRGRIATAEEETRQANQVAQTARRQAQEAQSTIGQESQRRIALERRVEELSGNVSGLTRSNQEQSELLRQSRVALEQAQALTRDLSAQLLRARRGGEMPVGWPEGGETKEEQIKKLSKIMSEYESVEGFTYGELRQSMDDEFRFLQGAVRRLDPTTRNYFAARMHLYDLSIQVPKIGNSIESCTKLGEVIEMSMVNTMMEQADVARAFLELERRSSDITVTDTKTLENIRKENPALADAQSLEDIRIKIALDLAVKDTTRVPRISQADIALLNAAGRDQLVKEYKWAVIQAETIWRAWGRAALKDGLVFNNGVSAGKVNEILSMRSVDIIEHWDEIEKVVDWGKSFSGSGEYTVRRLFHTRFWLRKGNEGAARFRKYVDPGARDFLSVFFNRNVHSPSKFITNGNNFKDGEAFKPESGNTDLNKDQVYTKEVDGIKQTITVRRNGIVELGENFDLGQVKWTAQGDAYFATGYDYKNLTQAEGVRKALMEKLVMDPSFKGLTEVYGAMERFTSAASDSNQADENRKNGAIYKDDVYERLVQGTAEYLTKDYGKDHKQEDFDITDADNLIDQLVVQGILGDRAANRVKGNITRMPGIIKFFYRAWKGISPFGIILKMLGEFFKQAVPMK